MRIALVTIGTRGDVQPYVAVGRALIDRGHEVVFATHREFEPLVRAHGFEFRPMSGGFAEIAQTELGRAWLASGDSPLKYAKYAKQLFTPLQEPLCEDADAAVEGCEAVVFYVMAVHVVHAVERRGLPSVALSPWPAVPTRHLAPPTASWAQRLPGPLRHLTWELVLRLVFGAFREQHESYRARVGLPRTRLPTPFHYLLRKPGVHLFSESVVPRPADWPDNVSVAGYAFAPRSEYRPPETLGRFLAAGPPPIYAGFGSMTGRTPAALANLVALAARRAGVRLVYARGWAGVAPEAPPDEVYVLDEVPHDWLFPRVRAVVHHGGAGTFAEGLRAGRPTVVIPFFGDQPFWADVNERLGTGVALQRKGLTEQKLGVALRRVTTEPSFASAAQQIADALARENGAARAAEHIERLVSR